MTQVGRMTITPSEGQFQRILETIGDALWVLDSQWCCTYINSHQAQLLGLPPDEILGCFVWDVFPDLVGTDFYHQLHWAVAEQTSLCFEHSHPTQPRQLESRVYPSQLGVTVLTIEISNRHSEARYPSSGSTHPISEQKTPLIQRQQTEEALRDQLRTEESLRQREEELRLITNAVPALIAYIDAQQRYCFNNRRYEDWFGPSASSLYGRYLWEVIGEGAYETIRPYVEQVLAGQSVTFESQVHLPGSGPRYISASYIPRWSDQGTVEGFVALVSDISDRKQAESILRQSQERLALAQKVGRIGVCEWEFETNQLTWTEEMEQLYGLAPGSFEGCYEDWLRRVHPGDRAQADAAARRTMAEGIPFSLEFRILLPDESIRWMAAKARIFRDEAGRPCRLIGVNMDITERKQAEAEIAALNQNLQNRVDEMQTLFEVIPIGILIADEPNFQYIRSNPAFAQILGIPTDTNASSTPIDQPPPSYKIFHNGKPLLPHETPLRYAALHGVDVKGAEVDIQRQDGVIFNLYGFASPLFDARGNVRGSVGAFLDITDRKQAEAEREQLLDRERIAREAAESANRIKDEFLAVLSHELRTPLNPILGWARLLRTQKFDARATDRALETIERNARLQTQLIEDLLDVSRILQGKMTLTIQPTNLGTVIEEALETMQLAADVKRITIQTMLDPTVGQVSGDPNRLQQVVWNLLSNAVKFTPAGGQVEIQLKRVGSDAVIQVKDTGKGINPEFLPHVFECFRQEDGRTTRQFGGLGLGLAIVRHLIELHGGQVQVESPGEELGTLFTVSLPLIDPAAATSPNRLIQKNW